MTRRPSRLLAALIAAALVPAAIVGVALAALGSGTDDPLARIPAAVVNDDEFVTTIDAEGDEQLILAGRLLVTELTGPDAPGFDWRPTSAADAERALAAGEVYAVVTIPSDFSASIATLGEPDARVATIRIQTDDAHSYLAGSVTQALGEALVAQFGAEITEQVLAGVVGGLGDLGVALAEAGDGARQLADGTRDLGEGVASLGDGVAGIGSGARELGSGLGALAAGTRGAADGAAQSADGSRQLADGLARYVDGVGGVADGVTAYVGGVDQLASGLETFAAEVEPLPTLGTAIVGVDQQLGLLSDSLSEIAAALATPGLPAEQQQGLILALGELASGAEQLSRASGQVAAQAESALVSVPGGVAESAAGARALADGGGPLVDGASQLAENGAPLVGGLDGLTDGLGELSGGLDRLASGVGQSAGGAAALADGATLIADGAAEAADGATQLADGADELGAGLTEGAAEVPSADDLNTDVLLSPVALDSARVNAVDGIGGIIVAALAPIALWLGALAASVAAPRGGATLVGSALGARAQLRRRMTVLLGVALAQGALVAVLAPLLAGAAWSALPGLLALALVASLAFAALHLAAALWLGRAATTIASLVALGVQAVVIGIIIPVEALVAPFPALAAVLPVPIIADGMLAVLAGGDTGRIIAALVTSALIVAATVPLAVAGARQQRSRAVRAAYVQA
ncbi:YhgE/Pip domain-containing protein [Microcella sp.]|uniref:YhgE/Pip domain-containing protein n=1 Tax=Microcella sp. TaxID=1913979 RepID=UPI00391B36EC